MTTSPTGIEERLDALALAVGALHAAVDRLGTPPPESIDVLYGVPAIAGAIRLNARQVYHLIEKSDLPTFRLGGKVCARRSSLNAWLADQEAKARSAANGG